LEYENHQLRSYVELLEARILEAGLSLPAAPVPTPPPQSDELSQNEGQDQEQSVEGMAGSNVDVEQNAEGVYVIDPEVQRL